jgi:hypothetical protein
MPQLNLTARRIGDLESRTEEYEVAFAVGDSRGESLTVKYQAARAYEINAALDACVETARRVIRAHDPGLAQPTDEALSQLSWRTIQSVKYEGGAPKTSTLDL